MAASERAARTIGARYALLAGARERGGATMSLVLLGAFGALAVVFMFVLPLLSGTEQTSRTQTAADAAALAGADEMWRSMPSVSFSAPAEGASETVDLLRPSAAARVAATTYARRNGAEVLAVTLTADGEVKVRVELDEPGAAGTEPVRRRATARTALAPACVITAEAGEVEETPEPEPEPPADPDDEPTDPPPPPPPPPDPPTEYSLSCSPGAAGVTPPSLDGETDFSVVRDAVRDFAQALLARPALRSALVG